MAAFIIFVEGAGTEPDPLPVFFVDSGEHAARICEGMEATEYRIYKFTFHEVSKSDLSKFPFWTEMTIDARDGIYGEIVAGIYDMIDRAYAIISQRRVHQKSVGNSNGNTKSDGGSVLPSTTKLPLIGDNVHLGMAELPGLTKLCTSLDQQHKPQGTLYRDEAGRFIYYVWDDDENSIGRTCQLVRPADAYEIVRNADEIHVDSVELFAEFEELQKQIAKELEVAFDDAISGYADSDWIGDGTLNNKAWRVRSKKQTGELFGEGASERGWYQSITEKKVIKKDKKGVWVYLTASHSENLKEFFSAFVT